MITTVNPDNKKFERNKSNMIYVDKTLIIDKLNNMINTDYNKICVSRPRRFGKTMTANLISAYYSLGCDSRALFEGTKLSKTKDWDKYLNKFNVIKIDVQGIYGVAKDNNTDLSKQIKKTINQDLIKQFPDIHELDVNESLAQNIISVYNATDRQFVMIMDEYDVLVRDKLNNEVMDNYLDLLNTLFKDDRITDAFALVYLTGIFPIVKDTFQSKLNNFKEYSIIDPDILGGFIGFTEDEVKELCEQHNMDFTECKNWYDGYYLKGTGSIYNPKSVVTAMEKHEFNDYWVQTGSFESVSDYITQNIDGLHDDIISMVKDKCKIDVNINKFRNRIDDLKHKDSILTYLIHLGYLAYDSQEHTCYIPNYEIHEEWILAIDEVTDLSPFAELYSASKCLYMAIKNRNGENAARKLDFIHHKIANTNTFGNEAALHTSLETALIYTKSFYTIHNEEATGNGYADIVLIPRSQYSSNPAIVIELKVDKSAAIALKQIKDRHYGSDLDLYKKNMLLVGINYNRKTSKHDCIVEKYQK